MENSSRLNIPYWQKFLITIRQAELMNKTLACSDIYKGYRIPSNSAYVVIERIEEAGFIKSEKKRGKRFLYTTDKGKRMASGLLVLSPYIYDDVETYWTMKTKGNCYRNIK